MLGISTLLVVSVIAFQDFNWEDHLVDAKWQHLEELEHFPNNFNVVTFELEESGSRKTIFLWVGKCSKENGVFSAEMLARIGSYEVLPNPEDGSAYIRCTFTKGQVQVTGKKTLWYNITPEQTVMLYIQRRSDGRYYLSHLKRGRLMDNISWWQAGDRHAVKVVRNPKRKSER